MEMRTLGKTGLEVSVLGIGLAEIGHGVAQEEVSKLLNTALDKGVNFLDTAACYGASEDLIGRTIFHRRNEYVLATKAGHSLSSYHRADWTAETIRDGIERSLTRLETDYLDLVQLHSCSVTVLRRGEVIRALLDARQAGKTRFIGYSGDNEAARWAVESGRFDTLQTSFSLVDQRARTFLFPLAAEKGMGIIAKRPIANATWGNGASSGSNAEYRRRAQIMSESGPIPGAKDVDPIVLALGFTLAHDEVATAIVGTSDLEHMHENIGWAETHLPIAREAVEDLRRRFDELSQGWRQQT